MLSEEWESMIEILTGWILKALSAIAPKRQGCVMGTGLNGNKSWSWPADFLPNLRKFLSFSSPTYYLLSTTYCFCAPPLSTKALALPNPPFALPSPPSALPIPPFALPIATIALPREHNRSLHSSKRSLYQAYRSLHKAIRSLPEGYSLFI